MMKLLLVAVLSVSAGMQVEALLRTTGSRDADQGKACLAQDLQNRMRLQNKLAGECEEMCKETGFYPDCTGCPNFVPPDPTPGVMTWEELWTHMDNLSAWGHDQIKSWHAEARGGKAAETMEEAAR